MSVSDKAKELYEVALKIREETAEALERKNEVDPLIEHYLLVLEEAERQGAHKLRLGA